ncbi:beta-carotene isomerase [Marchantia polymorpha subsp. ruderalis]|uniref:Beta-carotene isomerase D27-like C-terminal domain-containing protein n=2 Tax=Marchantia polymorpha TaxID=3197 RepID=A0AAF6C0C7_MARPO|nr:hypothetical protein MARPO_0123s0023 [Marchantia polymorpha]BBN17711.1 hypothetical protein Mp_7g16410 [Marchantia polymorpha subsp. ruderalis]|eukprot:PTQ30534.1 hypothetical protein MARPO_0123s0023 [Marchantia polymorpha]
MAEFRCLLAEPPAAHAWIPRRQTLPVTDFQQRARRVTVRCGSNPSLSKKGSTEYRDSWLDLAFIDGCRKAFGRVAGWQSSRSWEEGYLGMVEVSHALMRGRTAAEQQAAVLQGFPRVPDWFRKVFPYSDWGAELNARITPLFFEWLVGPCQVAEVQIGDKLLRSEVQIEKCRYLETSGCTGMCVNLCKVPTQYFFTSELGMPLYMEPNFEDLSCRMVFGQSPPPLSEDPALQHGCFSTCPSSAETSPCPKLR